MNATLYLRFPNEAAFVAVLPQSFTRYGETGWPLPDKVEAIRVVGAMHEGCEYDGEGSAIAPPKLITGFHVNVLGELPARWKPYQVFPKNPQGRF